MPVRDSRHLAALNLDHLLRLDFPIPRVYTIFVRGGALAAMGRVRRKAVYETIAAGTGRQMLSKYGSRLVAEPLAKLVAWLQA